MRSAATRSLQRTRAIEFSSVAVLGFRFAFRSSRTGRIRASCVVLAALITTMLLWFSLAVAHARSSEERRLAGREPTYVDAFTPDDVSSLPDSALALMRITDVWSGQRFERWLLAPVGAEPAVPPGLSRLPSEGEVFVSPRVRHAMAVDSSMAQRFEGKRVWTIGPAGLRHRNELLVYEGVAFPGLDALASDDPMTAAYGLAIARGFGGNDRSGHEAGITFHLVAAFALFVIVPGISLLATTLRFAGEHVDRRLSALRLLGVSDSALRLLAALESAVLATVGALCGTVVAVFAAPWLTRFTLPDGRRLYASGLQVPLAQAVAVAALVMVLAAGVGAGVTARATATSRVRVAATRHRSRAGGASCLVGLGLTALSMCPPIRSNETQATVTLILGLITFGLGLPLAMALCAERLGRWIARRARTVIGMLSGRRLSAEAGTLTRLLWAVPLLIYTAVCTTAFTNRTDASSKWADGLRSNEGTVVTAAVARVPGALPKHAIESLPGVKGVVDLFGAEVLPASPDALMPPVSGAIVASCANLQRFAPRPLDDCSDEPQLLSIDRVPQPRPETALAVHIAGTHQTFSVEDVLSIRGPKTDPLAGLVKLPPRLLPEVARSRRLLISVDGTDAAAVVENIRSVLARDFPAAALEVPDEASLSGAAEYRSYAEWAYLGLTIAAAISFGALAFGFADSARSRSRTVASLDRLGAPASVSFTTQAAVTAIVIGLGLLLAMAGGVLGVIAYSQAGHDPFPWQRTTELALASIAACVSVTAVATFSVVVRRAEWSNDRPT